MSGLDTRICPVSNGGRFRMKSGSALPPGEQSIVVAGAGDALHVLARGLHVLRIFSTDKPVMSLTEVAAGAELARPTARGYC